MRARRCRETETFGLEGWPAKEGMGKLNDSHLWDREQIDARARTDLGEPLAMRRGSFAVRAYLT